MQFDLNSGLLTVNLVLLAWVKADQISLWKRVNTHKHEIKCEVCKEVETTGVLLRES